MTFCNDDLKQVYHEIFDEALAAYNAKKKKTRDKIPDYYEHIRQGKQEKLFHEAIFQTADAAPPEGNGRQPLSKSLRSPSRSAIPICGCSIWCCTWTRPRPISM